MEEQIRRYRELRQNPKINYQLFEELVYLFPSILVIEADGKIDWFEEGYIRHEAKEEAKAKNLDEQALEKELDFVTKNTERVKEIFLEALKQKNKKGYDLSNDVLDLMLSAARVSSESQRNNWIFSNFHNFFDVFRGFLSYFIEPDPEKPFITEPEKQVMLEVLEAIDGLNDRNYEILKNLANDSP